MASHFISHDYLIRNKKTLDKTSVATPAQWTVPVWRAGKAYEQSQQLTYQGRVGLRHAFIAIEKLDGERVRKPYLRPSDRRVLNLTKKANKDNAS